MTHFLIWISWPCALITLLLSGFSPYFWEVKQRADRYAIAIALLFMWVTLMTAMLCLREAFK